LQKTVRKGEQVTDTAGEGTLELVVFKLKEGTTREEFLATDAAASGWMRQQPGFISHELSYAAESDRWIEIARWESLEEAEAAAGAAMSSDSCAPMFALIDMESALMLHGQPAVPPVVTRHAEVEA
jgi:Antibiotic biosynthesis monooxygenase